MPRLTECIFFSGTKAKLDRLGLRAIWGNLESVLTEFDLHISEHEGANTGSAVRELLDQRFRLASGWAAKPMLAVDWTGSRNVKSARVCLGVEIQFEVPADSDLLFVDLQDLIDEITAGRIDAGALVVPSDKLAYFLTDRVARYTDAVKAIERARATDLPLAVLALEHDGPGPALKKRQTRQGKK